jgi:hypothetical protein
MRNDGGIHVVSRFLHPKWRKDIVLYELRILLTFPAPVPEIPAANVDKAAADYVDTLGFTFDWGDDQGGIAGISRKSCIFWRNHPQT